MAITLDGTSGIIVSGNTNTLSGVTVGLGAGAVSTTTAVGVSALAANSSGGNCVAIGYQAGLANSTGGQSTLIGSQAGLAGTDLDYVTAVGYQALSSITSGDFNTALGAQALKANTSGANSTAVGYQAGYSNTTGGITAVGYQAGYANIIGLRCVFLGHGAGFSSTGDNNTLVGYGAGNASTGVNNTFVGAYNSTYGASGGDMTTGSKNTIIGTYTGNLYGLDIRTLSNRIVLSDGDGKPCFYNDNVNNFLADSGQFVTGVYSRGTGAQYYVDFRVGWTAGGSPGTQTGYIYSPAGTTTLYTTASDRRLKQNIVDAPSAINDVMAIGIKSFDWILNNEHQKYGVIAQDLHLIAPDAVAIPQNSEDMCAVDYSALVPMLIKSIQELKAQNESLKARLDAANL